MKKNKLYTVNRWNRLAFMPEGNLFPDGGLFNTNLSSPQMAPYVNWSDPMQSKIATTMTKGIIDTFTMGNNDVAGNFGKGPMFQNNNIFKSTSGPSVLSSDASSFFNSNAAGDAASGSKGFGKAAALQTAAGVGLSMMDSIPTGDKRGMWDTLDPVYHLAGGRESGAGNAMSDAGVTLTKAGLQSGQPYMALAGAALKVVGGLTNAAFGIKENKERKKAADASINTNRNFVSNATSFDDIKGPAAKVGTNIYEGGWFSGGKARDKNEQYALDMANAFNWADASVTNNAYNIFSDKIGDALRNYSAFGGPLEITDNNYMGAIEYDFMSDYLANKKKQTEQKNSIGNMFAGTPASMFAIGGDLQTNGADWSDGLVSISAGGSHEENPNDGVQMGVDNEGIPNLVEEGEVVFNDYVFSKRIGLDQAAKERFHFPRKKDITYADAAKRLEKEIAERPNDPISKASFKAQMEQLEEQQERQKAEMEAARAREAFEALSPEEQTALMQQRTEQEQMAQEAAQQQAMQEQTMAEQPSPEEAAMMQQQMMPEEQGIPMEGYAYGGNLFSDGGALKWLKKNYPKTSDKQLREIAKVIEKRITARYGNKVPSDLNYGYFYKGLLPSLSLRKGYNKSFNEESQKAAFDALVSDGMSPSVARNLLKGNHRWSKNDAENDKKWDELYSSWTGNNANTTVTQGQRFESVPGWDDGLKETAPWRTSSVAQSVVQRRVDPVEQAARDAGIEDPVAYAAARRATQPVPSGSQSGRQRAQSTAGRVASGKMNAGTWINGGAAENWNRYTRNGLRDFLMKVNEDIDNADTEEKKNEIRENAIKTVRGIQQAYSEAYQNNLTPSEVNEKVRALQTAFQNAGGNAYFYDIADNISLPQGHNTEDTEEKGWVDGLWGPRTSIRNWGSTEYGDDYDDIRELAQRAGMTYAPGQFKYGDNTLYELGMAQPEVVAAQEEEPEAAWDYGDPSIQSTETPENSGSVATDGNPFDERGIVANHRNDKLRYAGLLGPAVGLGMMAAGIGRPDTSGIDAAVNAGRGPAVLANWKPIGDYMAYKPNDPWFYTAPIIAQSNATQRSINNTTAPSRNAASLANAYNTMIALGKAQREQLDSNYGRYAQSKEFNRGTNQFNAQAYNQNQQFNADAQNRARQYGASLAMQGAAQKMAADAGWYNSLYGNVAGLFKGIGELGRENAQRNTVADMAASGIFGTVNPDRFNPNGMLRWETDEEMRKRLEREARVTAKGGSIKRKRGKRGLTI